MIFSSSSSSASSLLINPPPLLRAGSGRDINKYICIFAQAVYLYAQTVVCACAQYMDVISCDACVCDAPMLLFTIIFLQASGTPFCCADFVVCLEFAFSKVQKSSFSKSQTSDFQTFINRFFKLSYSVIIGTIVIVVRIRHCFTCN